SLAAEGNPYPVVQPAARTARVVAAIAQEDMVAAVLGHPWPWPGFVMLRARLLELVVPSKWLSGGDQLPDQPGGGVDCPLLGIGVEGDGILVELEEPVG